MNEIIIDKVIRKNGRVFKVVVNFGELEIIFERTKIGIRETSRSLLNTDRMYDREKLWIQPQWYAKIMRQVMAIFKGG